MINAYDSTRVENIKFENIFVEEFDFNGTESPRLIDFEITDKSWRECVGNCTINNVRINNVHVGCGLQQVTSQILGKNKEFGVDGVYIHNLKVQDKEIHSFSDLNMKVNEFAEMLSKYNFSKDIKTESASAKDIPPRKSKEAMVKKYSMKNCKRCYILADLPTNSLTTFHQCSPDFDGQ